jgi:hypothetical protein
MSKPKYTFMCWPTLDMCFDIHADSEDEALEKLGDLTKEIISDCCIKLFAIGAYAGNADFNYITDCESYEEEKFDV